MERGHPVRLSAKREQPLNVVDPAERAAHAGGQDVRASSAGTDPVYAFELPSLACYTPIPLS
jgi:hypothetical protein